MNGGGSSNIEPYCFTSVRDGMTARAAAAGAEVSYDDGSDPGRAADLADAADAAVVVVADTASEGADKPCLGLDCGAGPIGGVELDRDALIEAVAAANPRTIVVLETAGPVLTPWRGDVDAILEAWYPGMAAGERRRPSSCSATSIRPAACRRPSRAARTTCRPPAGRIATPGVDGVADYSEGVLVGYRWYDRKQIRPAYPFGFGLSYTRFALDGLRVARNRSGRRSRLAPGQKPRRSRRHGRAADLRPPAGCAGPDPAAAAAQGVRRASTCERAPRSASASTSTAATSHTGTALATAGESPPAATGSSSAAPRATSSTTSRSRCTAEAAGAADPRATVGADHALRPRAALPFRPAPRRPWRGGRAVECGGLENRCASIRRTEGSNPSPSAVEPGMAWISELSASPRAGALGSPRIGETANRIDMHPRRGGCTAPSLGDRAGNPEGPAIGWKQPDRRGGVMAKYLFEANYTQEGLKGVASAGGSARRTRSSR